MLLTISAHKPDGTLYLDEITGENPVVRALAAGATLREDAGQMFGFKPGPLLDGWVKVRSTSTRSLNGYVSYSIPQTGSLAAVSFGFPQTRAVFSHLATTLGFFTGVAMLNPGALLADVKVLVLDPQGNVLGSFSSVLRPGERISKLITELVSASDGQPRGVIWVKSSLPIYLTSLFGTLDGATGLPKTLANIPSQVSPEEYNPDEGLPELTVTPPLAFVSKGGTQTFRIQGGTGTPNWEVGGGPGSGTITSGNSLSTYDAPSMIPAPLPVTVTAERVEGIAGASLDVLDPQSLFQNLGVVQSVVYLEGLQQLYAAQLRVLGGLVLKGAGSEISDIVAIAPDGSQNTIIDYPDENITKMVPFKAIDGKEYLLLAGRRGDRIIRLDPISLDSRDLVTGINEPTALAFDGNGNLVVAVAETPPFRTIPRRVLGDDLSPAAGLEQPLQPPPVSSETVSHPGSAAGFDPPPTFQVVPGQTTGIAPDFCTGDIYFSQAQAGSVHRIDQLTGQSEPILQGLNNPGQLHGFYRREVGCPFSFQMLITERGANQITLFSPSQLFSEKWIDSQATTDLIFLTEGNPYTDQDQVILSQLHQGLAVRGPSPMLGELVSVAADYLYDPLPTNPPLSCGGTIDFADPNLAQVVRQALNLPQGAPITCQQAQALTSLNARSRGIRDLEGIQFMTGLQQLLIGTNSIFDVRALADLIALDFLELRANTIDDISPLAALTALQVLDLTSNNVRALTPLTKLGNLARLEVAENAVQDLDPLAGLSKLSELRLRGNDISVVVALTDLKNLNFVDLQDNPLNLSACPTILELEQGGAQILKDINCN